MQKNDLILKNSGVILTEGHEYWMGDVRLNGITGIISRQLFPDKYKEVPDRILRNAADRGTKVHESLQVYDMFGEITCEEARLYAELKEKEKFDVIDSEYIVTDYKDFATPIDKVVRFKDTPDGTVDLADVKNTSVLDQKYLSWQLSICKYLFNIVNPDIQVGKLYAIWTKNGVSLHPIDEIPQEEVIELLNCEREGRQYEQKDILTISDEKAVEVVKQMSEVLVEIKLLEEKKEKFNTLIRSFMNTHNIKCWENDFFRITLGDDGFSNRVDGERLKKDLPLIYDKYTKKIPVKGRLIITQKNNEDNRLD